MADEPIITLKEEGPSRWASELDVRRNKTGGIEIVAFDATGGPAISVDLTREQVKDLIDALMRDYLVA